MPRNNINENSRQAPDSGQLTVLAMAATAIVASQFGSGSYSNSDVIMATIAVFVLLSVDTTSFTWQYRGAFCSVCALTTFHIAETITHYAKDPMVNIGTNEDQIWVNNLIDLGFSTSLFLAIIVFFKIFIIKTYAYSDS